MKKIIVKVRELPTCRTRGFVPQACLEKKLMDNLHFFFKNRALTNFFPYVATNHSRLWVVVMTGNRQGVEGASYPKLV